MSIIVFCNLVVQQHMDTLYDQKSRHLNRESENVKAAYKSN